MSNKEVVAATSITILYQEYKPKLTKSLQCFRLGPQTEEIVQETFLRAMKLETPNQAWLYTVAKRLCLDAIKLRKPTTEVTDTLLSDFNIDTEFDSILSDRKVRLTIQSLPKLQAEVLSLRYLKGMSYQEISSKLKIPVNTVKTRLNRAKKLFKKEYQCLNS